MKQTIWAAFRKGLLFHVVVWGLAVTIFVIPGSFGREHDIRTAWEFLPYAAGISLAMFAVHLFAVRTARPGEE